MSNEIVKSEYSVDELARVAKMLSLSGYFDAKGDSDMAIAQIATKILAGRELGYGPFASVNGIHVIQGKPAISANLMAAAVKGNPKYDYRVRTNTDKAVSIEFFQGGESLGTSTFSMQDASAAGLNSPMWKKYPKNMLFARAMSNGVRWYCPDVFGGNAVYTPEELGDDVQYTVVEDNEDDHGTEIVVEPAKGGPTTTMTQIVEIPLWADGFNTEDIALIQSWGSAEDAKEWAVNMGACENIHEARNSLKKVVDNLFDGHLTKENMQEVFSQFFLRQVEKMSELGVIDSQEAML